MDRKEQRARIEELGNDAIPRDDADWGTDRQIEAENSFFIEVHEYVRHPELLEDLERYCHKATSDEMIAYALVIMGMSDDVDQMEITKVHEIMSPDDENVEFFLCNLSAWGKHPAEQITRDEALGQIAREEILAPHYYSVNREGTITFYVPDGTMEHACSTHAQAQRHLKVAIAGLWG